MIRVASGHAATIALALGLAVVTVLATAIVPGSVRGESSGWVVSGPRLKVLGQGSPGSPDSARVFQPAVVRLANGSYFMYYTGSDGTTNQILFAFSRDGIAWTKLTGSLSLNSGAGSPFVMAVGSGYRMWFESVIWGSGPLGYTDRIYGANSPDGVHWTLTGLVLDVGNASDWDGGSVGDPVVVQAGAHAYRMYYSMYAANHTGAVGVALSTDLITFTKWPGNPVLQPGRPGSWDDSAAYSPSVVAGANWSLFYWGYQASTGGQIGVARSVDGYNWARSAQPFLAYDLGGSWDSAGVGWPEFVQVSSPRLYFSGGNGAGEEGIGMVNLTTASSGGAGPPGRGGSGGAPPPNAGIPQTFLGLPTPVFLLLSMLAGAVASVAIAMLVTKARGLTPRR